MSKIFKSNYVKIGTPKHVKSNTPPVMKVEEPTITPGIKKQSAEELASTIIDDAKQMYLRIIEEANHEAQNILDAANQQKEAIQAEAANQGYSDGYNSGYSEGLNQAESFVQQSMTIRDDLDQRRAAMYAEAETEVMELVLDIAQKVIGQELTLNQEVIFSLIKQALEKCAFKDKLTIRVSSDDFDYTNSIKDRIVALTEGINELEVLCDKALSKGSCIVETDSGEINAGINVQMKEVKKAFEYMMRNE